MKLQKFVDACIIRRTGVWSYEVEMEGVIRRRHADQLRRRHYVPPTVTEMGDVTDSCEYLSSQNFDEHHTVRPAFSLDSTKSPVGEPVIGVPASQSALPSEDGAVNNAVSDPDERVPFLSPSPCSSPCRSTRVSKPPPHFYEQFDL